MSSTVEEASDDAGAKGISAVDHVETVTVTATGAGVGIRATVAVELEALAQGVLTTFVEHESRWRDGFRIPFGWGPLSLRTEDAGYRVVAPDYETDPFEGVKEDLTLAISFMGALDALPTAAGVEATAIAFDDDVICVREWERHPMLSLSRIDTTTAKDSGWFVEPFPPTSTVPWRPEQLVRLPAWRVARARRAVGRCFALPVGVAAIVDGDSVRTVVREGDREVLAGGAL
ncbi:hypothetical protein ACWGJP_11770 [Microbacterium sp. NPDC055903]